MISFVINNIIYIVLNVLFILHNTTNLDIQNVVLYYLIQYNQLIRRIKSAINVLGNKNNQLRRTHITDSLASDLLDESTKIQTIVGRFLYFILSFFPSWAVNRRLVNLCLWLVIYQVKRSDMA